MYLSRFVQTIGGQSISSNPLDGPYEDWLKWEYAKEIRNTGLSVDSISLNKQATGIVKKTNDVADWWKDPVYVRIINNRKIFIHISVVCLLPDFYWARRQSICRKPQEPKTVADYAIVRVYVIVINNVPYAKYLNTLDMSWGDMAMTIAPAYFTAKFVFGHELSANDAWFVHTYMFEQKSLEGSTNDHIKTTIDLNMHRYNL